MKNRVLVIALRIFLFLFLCGIIAVLLFYALRCGERYSVSFDSSGGSEVQTMTVEKGGAIDAPTVTREGYDFECWTLDGAAVEFPFAPSGDCVLSAVWRIKVFTVTFDYGEVASVNVNYGDSAELFSPTRDGEFFDGWFTASGEEYTGEAVTCNLNLVAKFTAYDFTFSESEATITGGAVSGKIVVPSTVAVGEVEFSVTAISDGSFEGANSLTAAVLPDTVKSLGARSFYNCAALRTIDLGGAQTCGELAFFGCAALSAVSGENATYNSGVLELGGEIVFAENAEGDVSSNAVKVVRGAFAASSVTRVTLAECESVEEGAFDGCSELVEFYAPKLISLQSAFDNCAALKSVNLGSAAIPPREFYGFALLTEVATTSTVIGAYALSGTGITTVNIASGAFLGEGAFKDCAALTVVSGDPRTVSSYAFSNCVSLTSFAFSAALESVGAFAFDNCRSLSEFTGESENFFTNGGALYGSDGRLVRYPSAKSGAAILPDVCKYIGARAFEGAIIDAVYADAIEIGEYAFLDCASLSAAEFGESLARIERGAFFGCDNLITLTLSSLLPPVAQNVFDGNAESLRVYVPNVTAYSDSAFAKYL